MARATATPFRRVLHDQPQPKWYIKGQDDRLDDLPAALNDWEPAASIPVAVQVDVSLDQLQQTGLSPNAKLRINLSWYCRTTQVRGIGTTTTVRREPATYTLECNTPGDLLGGEVEFRIALVLAAPGARIDHLVAQIPGSVLWEATRKVVIEGIGGRFPMVWVDFPSAGLPERAAWYLDWDPYAMDEMS